MIDRYTYVGSYTKRYPFCFCIEPIAGTPPSQSLEDVTLDQDIDLEQQLNDFLQTGQEEQEANDESGDGQTKETSENVENKEQS
jgi:hypothetical protein